MKGIAFWLSALCVVACGKSADTSITSHRIPADAASANTSSRVSDASDTDAFGCRLPYPGCGGCNPLGLTGSWYASQLQNCQLTLAVEAQLGEPPIVNLVVDCQVHAYSDTDAGYMWNASPPYEVTVSYGTVTMIDLTLTLPTDICELVKNNDGARVDVFATPCPIALMCGG